jgi:hypothetical protein
MTDKKEPTHKAIARYRIRNSVDWVELGNGRFEYDAVTGKVSFAHALLKCMPIGGFDGYILFLPIDATPPPLGPPPQRPGQPSDEEDA